MVCLTTVILRLWSQGLLVTLKQWSQALPVIKKAISDIISTLADNDNENEIPADQEMTHDIIEGQVSEQSKTESETLSTQGNNKSLISLSLSIADCIEIERKWLPFSSSLKVIGPGN